MRTKLLRTFAIIPTLLLTSCGAIFGGSKYNANIVVENRPNATITYNGKIVGHGSAVVPVKRSDANKFQFTVNENDQEQTFVFKKRRFRGWAFT